MNLQRKYYSGQDLLDKMSEYIVLFKMGFTSDLTEEIMYQRYYTNPFGEFVMCVFEDADADNRLVGFAAALPTPSYINGKEIKGAIAINGTTHPDYKGHNVFPDIMKGLNEELKNQGYAFVYAFPHYTSNRLFRTKFEWKDVAAIPTFAHAVSEDADYFKYANPEVHPITFDDTKWTPTADICIGKSPAYLKWRYYDEVYKTVGDNDGNFIIYKPYNDEINMVELYAKTKEVRSGLIAWLLDYAQKNSYKKVTTFVRLNTETHTQLEQFDFRLSAPVRFFALKQLSNNLELDIYDSRNWSVSMGDHNAY